MVYLALTGAGMLALWLLGVDWHSALLHAPAGISTGGFSTHDNSLAGLGGWPVQAVMGALSLAGAVSLALYHPPYHPMWRGSAGYLELRGLLTASVLAGIALGLGMALVGHTPWMDVARTAPMMAVSAQTGAGFSNISVAALTRRWGPRNHQTQ